MQAAPPPTDAAADNAAAASSPPPPHHQRGDDTFTGTIRKLTGPDELLPHVQSFVELSAGTEFDSYKEPQWRFLLAGNDITAFIAVSNNNVIDDIGRSDQRGRAADVQAGPNTNIVKLIGCVLRINLQCPTKIKQGRVYRPIDFGYGMVLVRNSHRRKGVAGALIKRAMQIEADVPHFGGRHVLAVCSPLGQPLYRGLGFQDTGEVVTHLTISVGDVLKLSRHELFTADGGSRRDLNYDGDDWGENGKDFGFLDDSRAYADCDRYNILKNCEYSSGARSFIAWLTDITDCHAEDRISFVLARQDCKNGPLLVGPMVGREECCLPLIYDLVQKSSHWLKGDTSINMMIPGHKDMVKQLLAMQGMEKLWEWPSMTSDGKQLFGRKCDAYLMMMHPTLG